MSKLFFSAAAVTFAALTWLPAVQGQQSDTDQPRLRDRQPAESQPALDGRHEARRISYDADSKQGPTVAEALVQKLFKANEAEIELARMAQEKSDNQEVQRLADMIIRDHQALNQSLRQLPGHGKTDSRHEQGQVRNRSARDSGTAPEQTRRQLANDQQSTTREKASDSARVPQQLCEISDQACDNALKMTKEMLSNYDGQDFNMAFLGQQCVAHTMLLAELKAIESMGPEQLQEIAQKAAAKVESHLNEAKQLAKKLENDRASNG